MKHAMTLKSGFPGVSKTVIWSYRGYTIAQRFRTYDVRNKTHKGFSWSVLDRAGLQISTDLVTRKEAKARVDYAVAGEAVAAALAN